MIPVVVVFDDNIVCTMVTKCEIVVVYELLLICVRVSVSFLLLIVLI